MNVNIAILSNGTSLETEFNAPSDAIPSLAVFLHPWSWLGGQMHDPVVSRLVDMFTQHKYHTLRYNSRGVGSSKGWPSLSGLTEGEDLRALVGWAVERVGGNVKRLVLVGYSHGSLITTLCPPLYEIPTSYIIVSYPLGPRSWLTLFHSSSYNTALTTVVSSKSPILIVYGTEDEFTGAVTYERWTEQFESTENVQVHRVDGASHFWRGSDGHKLSDAVDKWIQRLQ